MPRISLQTRKLILSHWRRGLSLRNIAETVNCSHQAVFNIIKKKKLYQSVRDKPKSGRPRKTSPADDRQIRKFVLKNRFSTAKEVKNNVDLPSNVSLRLIQRRLVDFDLKCYRAAKKPMISRINKKKRERFAQLHADWNHLDWKSVAFSDESRFNLIGNDSQHLVRRFPNERYSPNCLRKTSQHGGGSVMVWGVVTFKGPGPLVFLDQTLNGQKYLDILKHTYIPYWKSDLPSCTVFQHDNAPPHRCKAVQQFLTDNNIATLPWPPQSPDLNVIENCWNYVKKQLRNYKAAISKPELKKQILEIWRNIPTSFVQALISSMPRRMAAVKQFRGNPTKY